MVSHSEEKVTYWEEDRFVLKIIQVRKSDPLFSMHTKYLLHSLFSVVTGDEYEPTYEDEEIVIKEVFRRY